MNQIDLQLDVIEMRKAALVFRAVNHNFRQQILKLLQANEKLNVTDIYVRLRVEQSVASQHLSILRKAAFVVTQRDGKNIYYSINHDRLSLIQELGSKITAQ